MTEPSHSEHEQIQWYKYNYSQKMSAKMYMPMSKNKAKNLITDKIFYG